MRITSKGQVTIPQAIREKSGLLPNTDAEFEIVRGRVVLRPATSAPNTRGWAKAALQGARGSMDEPMFRGLTTEEIMEFLRGDD